MIAFDSPIEQAFWDAWVNTVHYEYIELIPQYPIGKYRVDFACVLTKTAIELDGFATHSSTDDIARDRKRQREIEAMGWLVLRFGGKEVFENARRCAEEAGNFLKRRPIAQRMPNPIVPKDNLHGFTVGDRVLHQYLGKKGQITKLITDDLLGHGAMAYVQFDGDNGPPHLFTLKYATFQKIDREVPA